MALRRFSLHCRARPAVKQAARRNEGRRARWLEDALAVKDVQDALTRSNLVVLERSEVAGRMPRPAKLLGEFLEAS